MLGEHSCDYRWNDVAPPPRDRAQLCIPYDHGSTITFACCSGLANSTKALFTPPSPTCPVISGVTSIRPSARRNKRRPYVSLIWCSMPSGHGNGLRPRIRTSGRRNTHEPVNLILDFEHAHVSGHSIQPPSFLKGDPPATRLLNLDRPFAHKLPVVY